MHHYQSEVSFSLLADFISCFSSCQDPRAEQLKYELEKKDQEIDKLKKNISQWEVSTHKQLSDLIIFQFQKDSDFLCLFLYDESQKGNLIFTAVETVKLIRKISAMFKAKQVGFSVGLSSSLRCSYSTHVGCGLLWHCQLVWTSSVKQKKKKVYIFNFQLHIFITGLYQSSFG